MSEDEAFALRAAPTADDAAHQVKVELPSWPCEAYGERGLQHGACCFFADRGMRSCPHPAVCHFRMRQARTWLWNRLQKLAASDNEEERQTALAMLEGFSGPEDLLGGSS